MRYRPFGRTGMQVSVVGFGCWPMAGDRYGAIEDDQAVKAIHRALDLRNLSMRMRQGGHEISVGSCPLLPPTGSAHPPAVAATAGSSARAPWRS
jgi:hypothetical protein